MKWLILTLEYNVRYVVHLLINYSLSLSLTHTHTDDVAVIDEAQMIRDEERGGAWTRAILGTNNSFNNILSLYLYMYTVDPFIYY